MNGCSVTDCARPHEARGLCTTHYARLRRTGSAELTPFVPKPCSVEDCDRDAKERGLCHRHYMRLRRTGSLASPIQSLRDRFDGKVERTDGCWLWTGTVGPTGYGQIGSDTDRKRMLYAHRVSYELHVGPIPAGLEIDHTCHTDDPECPGGPCLHRRCVNPKHLEPVTTAENQRRAQTRTRRSA